MSILTREEAWKLESYYAHHKGVYEYKTKDGFAHLIYNGEDLLEGKQAVDCDFYLNGDYEYKTKDGYYHLFRDGKDLLEGLEAVYCYSYHNGDYSYQTAEGQWYTIKNN